MDEMYCEYCDSLMEPGDLLGPGIEFFCPECGNTFCKELTGSEGEDYDNEGE